MLHVGKHSKEIRCIICWHDGKSRRKNMVHFNIEGNALKKKWWEGQAFVRIDRDSHPELFCKKGILKDVAKFIHRKTPVPGSLFNKVAGLRSATLLKKRLWDGCFLVNFAKFLGTPFFIEHLWWLLLYWRSRYSSSKSRRES